MTTEAEFEAMTEKDLDDWADHFDVLSPLFESQAEELGVSYATLEYMIDYARTKARGLRLASAGHALRAKLCESQCAEIRQRLWSGDTE